jgi:hypothetical protein
MLRSISARLFAGAIGVLASLTACSGSDFNATPGGSFSLPQGGDGGSPAGPAMTPDAYCQALANLDSAWCDYADKCCSAADKQDLTFAPPACALGRQDSSTCKANLTKHAGDGSIVFHGEYAQSCIGELSKWVPPAPTSCSGMHLSDHMLTGHFRPAFAQVDACRKTELGQIKSGGPCEYDSQCDGDLRCRSYAGSSTDFRCQPLSHQGEPCNLKSDCDAALSCIGNVGASTCDTLHTVGQACTFTSDCQDALLCDGTSCVRPGAAGDRCTNGSQCGSLLGCNLSTQTCVPLGANGASCTFAGQCDGRCDATTHSCVSTCGGTW